MSDERQVPGGAADNNDRIQSRAYESDFARLPREEVESTDEPGAGPQGSRSSADNSLPAIVIGLGVALVLATFFFDTSITLFLGVMVMVVGFVWARRRSPRPGAGEGIGPATFDNRDQRDE